MLTIPNIIKTSNSVISFANENWNRPLDYYARLMNWVNGEDGYEKNLIIGQMVSSFRDRLTV